MVKVVLFRFQKCLVPLNMLLLEGSSEWGLFRDFFNHVFWSLQYGKYICYDGDLLWFFENAQNLIYISKMQKEIEEMLFVSEIIASELAVLNCLY